MTTTFYGSNVLSTIGGLTQACQVSTAPGGVVEATISITAPSSGTNSYLELVSQGGTPGTTPALPNPTGKGWAFPMAGNTIPLGNWSSLLTLAKSGTSNTGAKLFMRFYRRTMDGIPYLLAQVELDSQTLSTTKTLYTFAAVSGPNAPFIAGETLYIDAFAFNGSQAWASDVFTVYVSNSATAGITNDLNVISPTMVTTTQGLTALVSNVSVPAKDQAISLARSIDNRSILNWTGLDSAGTGSYVRGQPVSLSDSIYGMLYQGFVNNDKPTKLGPMSPNLEHAFTCMDKHYLADKRANKTNYLNWQTGDIIADFIAKTLFTEGVSGAFAIESDYSQAAFAAGTLTNAAATTTTSPPTNNPQTAPMPSTSNTGDLEIARAGSTVTITESTTSDFGSGTLTTMTATSNSLKPTTQSALKVTATVPVTGLQNIAFGGEQTTNGSGTAVVTIINSKALAKFWSGSQALGTNDHLNYDIWIQSTSPAYMAGVTLGFGDGTDLVTLAEATHPSGWTTSAYWDQNYLPTDPTTDLTNWTKDQWYTRTIDLSAANGKTVTSVSVFIAGNPAGTYTVYIKNCYLSSVSGSPFFSTSATAPNVNPPTVTVTGQYIASLVTTAVVQAYLPTSSSRVSPAHSISGVGLVQNSLMTWTASNPVVGPTVLVGSPGAATTAGNTLIFVSYDGNAWLPTTNSAALPGLPAGANVAGISLYLREQFQSGPDPTAIPSLLQVTITINSAANASTTDDTQGFGTTSQWNSGTNSATGPDSNGHLTPLSSFSQNWSGGITNQDFFSGNTGGGGTVTQGTSIGAYIITIPAQNSDAGANAPGYWGVSRLDAFGQPLDFIFDIDLSGPCYTYTPQFCGVSQGLTGDSEIGILYRTSNWDNNNNSWGYFLGFYGNYMELGHGSNSATSPTFTQIFRYNATFTANTTYHLTLVVRGNRHTVFLNHASSPVIDVIDSTITTAGYIGLRNLSNSITASSSSCAPNVYINVDFAANTATFNNVALTDMITSAGIWTSPSLSLNTLGTCGNTQIAWTELNIEGQVQTKTIVQTSIDGGTTYQACVSGQGIPGLTSGTSVSGKTLLIQVIVFQTSRLDAPYIWGLYARVCGNFGTVTGTRVSPALSLTPVDRVGYSTIMWNANTPGGTTVVVATSQDNATWTNQTNNSSLSYWTAQPAANQDLFISDTHTNYTNTSKNGGSTASWTYDTPNSRITASGGSGALFLYSTTSASDVDLLCDMDESDAGGLVWREVDTSDYYELGVYDASSGGGFTNQLRLYKVASNVRSLLGTASTISFTRGTFHRVRVNMKSGLINVYFDGVCVQEYLDTSPLGAGLAGLRNDGGTSRYYQLWIQPLGTSVSGQVLYTRVTMTTSDPAQMPQLFVLVASVRGPSIASGATISQLHPVTVPFAQYFSTEMDTLMHASGDYYWMIDMWGSLSFGPRQATPGAFPIASANSELLYTPAVMPTAGADLFRNRQVVTDVTNLVTPAPELKVADGSTTSWAMGYPLYSAPTVLVGGQAASVGVQGIDTGKSFYWQPGSPTISYDSTLPKIPAGTILSFSYVGQTTVNVIVDNSSSQTAQATLETGTSGIIEEIESAISEDTRGMTTTQATTYANGLLVRLGNNAAMEMIATITKLGIVPATMIAVFVPEMSIWNLQLPVVKTTLIGFQTANPAYANGVFYELTVDATNGPNLSNPAEVWF